MAIIVLKSMPSVVQFVMRVAKMVARWSAMSTPIGFPSITQLQIVQSESKSFMLPVVFEWLIVNRNLAC